MKNLKMEKSRKKSTMLSATTKPSKLTPSQLKELTERGERISKSMTEALNKNVLEGKLTN